MRGLATARCKFFRHREGDQEHCRTKRQSGSFSQKSWSIVWLTFVQSPLNSNLRRGTARRCTLSRLFPQASQHVVFLSPVSISRFAMDQAVHICVSYQFHKLQVETSRWSTLSY